MNFNGNRSAFDAMGSLLNYKYNGKELQETGMYDYGARFYMPDIGRWGVIDPRSQYTHEAYSFVWNNPINFWDPTGMEGEEAASETETGGERGAGGFDGLAGGGKCPPNCPDFGNGGKPYSIEEIKLTGKAKESSSNTVSSSTNATWLAAGVLNLENGAGEVILLALLGKIIWDSFHTPSTGYTTIADPGVGMRSLNSDSEAEKDTNGVEVPKEGSSTSGASPDPSENQDKEGIGSRNAKKGDKMGSNQRANKMIDDAARKFKLDRRSFGKYVENKKAGMGKGGADNFTWKELENMAKQFKSGAR